MGNCTSKKSKKSLKLSAKSLLHNKMNKDQDTLSKGLSKKIAPFTKGEVTLFGFKKKQLSSQLPVPITLTSNGHSISETNEKQLQNGVANQKNSSDGYQSGSSVESLCHATFRSTPKMVRKRDLVKQNIPTSSDEIEPSLKNSKPTHNPVPVSLALRNGNNNGSRTNAEPAVNRFGFRQPTPPRATNNTGKNIKKITAASRAAFITGQDETRSNNTNKKVEISTRSRSEGPREAFFKENLQSTSSVQSGLNQSKSLIVGNIPPGKFTFQTSHLPRPQFPTAVKMSETKTAKTAMNNYRKGETRNDSYKYNFVNEDSGFESHPSVNSTLEKHIEILESSPGNKVRKNLPTFKGKKLEMKIVGNKFELLKKEEKETSSNVVTEISLIKLPATNIRNSTAIINTGLVEQRTCQYLKKISQPFNNKKEIDEGAKNSSKMPSKPEIMSDSNNRDEGLGAESEEEKLFKDSNKSEKSSVKYLMSEGCGEDILPGETMAEDVSLCLSFEEELSSGSIKNSPDKLNFVPEIDVTPNTIRLDALKLSKQLKYKNNLDTNRMEKDSTIKLLNVFEKDEDTFPSDSILEQLSDSDSLGDKGENKNNEKEKNVKMENSNFDKEDLGIDLDEEENSKGDTDVDENDLELNLDETEIKDDNKNCLGTQSPDSPGTPTHASNSLSLSDGRDFLIDDEIADQPQLCLSESYVESSCKEEIKTQNEKTTTVNEFVTCCDVQTNTTEADENESLEKYNENGIDEESDLEKIRIKERKRINSEGTLSPCESINSDDLMLDFEMNSIEESGGRLDVNENVSVENFQISTSRDEIRDFSCQRINSGSGSEKSAKTKEENSNCSTPASGKSVDAVSRNIYSPYRSSRTTPLDENSIKLDKISYENMSQDIVDMKSMLFKLKRLLLESEGGLQENGRKYPEDGFSDFVIEDELTDLRRQVLFLQQQLEEREKIVQVLRLKISQTSDTGNFNKVTDSKKQSNAATQTGLDQFQQDFPHFRIFQTTPVV